MYNSLAYLALFGWIPVTLVLFARLRPPVAVTLAFLGPFLLLPASLEVDYPLIPPIDRHVVGGVGALLGYLLFVRNRDKAPLTASWPLLLIAAQVLTSFLTVIGNGDPMYFGPFVLPGLSLHDSLGVAFLRLVTLGLPFYLGMRLIRSPADLATVLRLVVAFGLFYVPIIVWENRMSPELHAKLYGVFPHNFLQHMRAGGWRPVGFTVHGLELALFMSTAVVAAAGLARARLRFFGYRTLGIFVLLLLALVFCRSLGALLFGLVFPLLLFTTGAVTQQRVIAALASIVLLYPLARSRDLFPTDTLVEVAMSLSEERGQSIEFRFDNEDLLLARADERPLLGWGVWGRNRVYDPISGRDAAVTDGYWILELGMFGLVGFASFFALLTLPAYLAARNWRRIPRGPARTVTMTVALIVVLRAVDFLPNAFPAPFTMFLPGALMHTLSLRAPRERHSSAAAARAESSPRMHAAGATSPEVGGAIHGARTSQT